MAGSTSFDHIVIGVGSMGAAALFHLAERGRRVLGIERFGIVHDRGSHGGQSRIIRKAYFEHPDYIPLLQRAYGNWRRIEALTGEGIYKETGLFYAGPKGHPLLQRIADAAHRYGIGLERFDAAAAQEAFPMFRLPAHHEALFEPEAGLLRPDRAIRAYVSAARASGAMVSEGETVTRWERRGARVFVTTDRGEYDCGKLVITAGPWSAALIPGVGDRLKVTRQLLAWTAPEQPAAFREGRFPCWMMVHDGEPGVYYGFPSLVGTAAGEPSGPKSAYHHAGMPVDPSDADRSVGDGELRSLVAYLRERIPGICTTVTDTRTCLYSYSPDEHFVIDNLPGAASDACIAWGFSGHGFKFASVVGEILADLAMEGRTELPIGFLGAGRFG